MLDWNLRNVFCAGCGRPTGKFNHFLNNLSSSLP
jgi:hypothetical protein